MFFLFVCFSSCRCLHDAPAEEGESQAVGGPIGLLVDSEADIPAVEAYAKVLKSGGEAVAAPVAAAAPDAAAPPSPKQQASGENGDVVRLG